MSEISITLPLNENTINQLKSGDEVLLNGKIYTARDAAHKKLLGLLQSAQKLPLDILGQVFYYTGPCPAPEGKPIGTAGPTTSDRMDPFTPTLLTLGLKGMIGKGPRSPQVRSAIVRNKAIYFGAIGGAGALLAKSIKSSRIIAFPELDSEAIRELEVENFPAIVINDAHGNDLYEQRNTINA